MDALNGQIMSKKKYSLGHGIHHYPTSEGGVVQVVLGAHSPRIYATIGSILWTSGNVDVDFIDSRWNYVYRHW
jgi:hypothetical protein